ncbi:MAG: cobalamin biosynthesis protein CobD [Spirochaetaceae bacterium]|nr:cobalamin biosynthesis protein CobD [Spirochaetaceae bacterium]
MKNYILLVIAIVLDLLFGDPVTPIHPVRLIGSLILKIEYFLYNRNLSKRFTGFIGVSISLGIVIIIFFFLYKLSCFIPYGKEIFSVLIFYSTIAIKDLAVHGMRIKKALDNSDILLARKNAGMILSRDVDNLSQEKIITGTVESISENSSDSIIAPVFWGLVLGPAGALTYRLINTMDAMWGYKNERYIDFGRTAAILDDVINYIPARLTGLLICLVSGLNGWGSGKVAGNPLITTWQIMIRNHDKTASPNAGYPEAAMAGALGIQLGGEASYFGKIINKPTIGDNTRNPDAGDISTSLKIIEVSVLTFIILSGIVNALIEYLGSV